jgi:hypothetical protein
MKHTLTKFDFMDGVRNAPNNPFSYGALEILWDYLTDLEYGTGEEIEFDPVAFRCEFCEQSFNEIISDYKIDAQGLNEEVGKKTVMEFLQKNTTIIGITEQGTILFQNF